MTTTTFKRVTDSDIREQIVFVDDTEIGTIWRAWFRLGGESWTNSRCGTAGFPTRREAAADLHRRFTKEPQQ